MLVSPQEMEHLSGCALFAGLDREQVCSILSAPQAQIACFAHGETVYSPQHFQRSLAIVLSGQLQVTKGALSVSTLHPGELFGAAALYSDAPEFASTVTAHTDCRCLLLPQQLVDKLLSENEQLRRNYLCYLTGRIRFLSSRLQSLSQSGAEGKLARYLLSAARDGVLSCPATQLSQRLGISRASIYRAFAALEEGGLITRTGKTIRITDPGGLAGLV